MKVVVFIDLIATMVLPASYVVSACRSDMFFRKVQVGTKISFCFLRAKYAMYLMFLVFVEDLPVSTVLLILYGIIMGVQVIVFILRSRWE